MKYNKNIQNKVFQEKIFKTSKSRGCGNPPNSKNIYINRNKRKRKGKDKGSYIFIV